MPLKFKGNSKGYCEGYILIRWLIIYNKMSSLAGYASEARLLFGMRYTSANQNTTNI